MEKLHDPYWQQFPLKQEHNSVYVEAQALRPSAILR